jgi:hypothetical protein
MKDNELRALLAEVESEIGGLIRAEGLNKAEGQPPVEETPGEESPPPPAAEGSAQAPEGAPMESAPEAAPRLKALLKKDKKVKWTIKLNARSCGKKTQNS